VIGAIAALLGTSPNSLVATHGLGRGIAKQIVEQHKSRIEVTNRPEGGALVRVLLPRHTST